MPWKELARLEDQFEVVIRSYLDADKRLAWRMTVNARAPNPPPPPLPSEDQPLILAEAGDIRDVVRKGIDEAKRLGLIS